MTIEELALEHQETKDRSIRNEGRIKKLEEESGVLHQLATSVAVLAEQVKGMASNIATLTSEVEEMKDKPGKRWDSLIDKAIWAVAGAVIAYMLRNSGL